MSQFSRDVEPEIGALLRLALSLSDQPADAEDLVQETLLRAYRSISRFDGEHPRAWLFTIMRRAHANTYRTRKPQLVGEPRAMDTLAPKRNAVDVVEREIVEPTFDAVVEVAFAKLSTNDQEVLRLVDIGGLDYAGAAMVLGVTIDAVASRLHRARARLREDLADSGFAPKPRFRWQGESQ